MSKRVTLNFHLTALAGNGKLFHEAFSLLESATIFKRELTLLTSKLKVISRKTFILKLNNYKNELSQFSRWTKKNKTLMRLRWCKKYQ